MSAQQIADGKFGSVTLFTRDAFAFQGNVTLNAAQAISLEEGYITDSSPTGSVTLNAPYVLLSGQTPDNNSINGNPLALISGFSKQVASGAFTVNAALIDIASEVRFGGVLPAQGSKRAIDLAGFATVNLNSSGDLRFAPALTTDAWRAHQSRYDREFESYRARNLHDGEHDGSSGQWQCREWHRGAGCRGLRSHRDRRQWRV